MIIDNNQFTLIEIGDMIASLMSGSAQLLFTIHHQPSKNK